MLDIRFKYQDQIYKLCQDVRNALDFLKKIQRIILSVLTFVLTFFYP